MEDRTVIVGCGYVGAAVAESLRDRPLEPRSHLEVTTRSEHSRDRLRSQGFAAWDVDVRDVSALRDCLARAGSVIVTVAAGSGGSYEETYAEGLRNVVAALDPGSRPRLVYTSSSGVYAEDAGGWVDEESPVSRSGERSRALVEAETAVLEAGRAGRCRGTVLRLSGILGPGRGPQRRLDQLAGATRDDADAWLNLVWIDDIVDAIRAALSRGFEGIVNVSGARPLRKRELYDVLLERTGRARIRWEGQGTSLGKRVSIERLRSRLGVEPSALDPRTLPLS